MARNVIPKDLSCESYSLIVYAIILRDLGFTRSQVHTMMRQIQIFVAKIDHNLREMMIKDDKEHVFITLNIDGAEVVCHKARIIHFIHSVTRSWLRDQSLVLPSTEELAYTYDLPIEMQRQTDAEQLFGQQLSLETRVICGLLL